MKKKLKIRRMMATFLAALMVVTLLPAPAFAYLGAMTRDEGNVTSGSQDGYLYLKNSYIGFYIRPDGSLTTVPSQKGLNDVKAMGFTENHAFYSQTINIYDELNPVKTDMSRELVPYSRSARIDSSAGKQRLVQTFMFSGGARIDITYELVRLDKGAPSGTTAQITEHDGSDSGKTWGVFAEAKISNAPENTNIRWTTRHVRFGGVAHNAVGNIRQSRSSFKYDYNNYTGSYTHFTSPLYSTTGSVETISSYYITEVFTDSFSYANQFIALEGYASAIGWSGDGHGGWIPTLIAGVRGHLNGYGSYIRYSSQNNSTVDVDHDFLHGEDFTWALWGFRDLFETDATNIPADPVSIPPDAGCLGIVKNNNSYSAVPAQNESELKERYGSNLVAVFRGAFKQESNNFVFQNGAVQLAPSLTATWTEGSGRFTVSSTGAVTTQNVHLSAPTFKFYKPKWSSDNSLVFSYVDGKLKVTMVPDNNGAILHIDIPGAKCSVETVTAAMDSNIVFTGEMGISTPFIDAANLDMKRLGLGMKNNVFGVTGVDASGAVDMEKLLGLDVGGASAEINTFPGEERYAFQLELNVFEMFEAEGELELKRIYTGALIPNTLKIRGASEVGVPLVPPVVVAEFNGLSGGFSNLADTINGDFSAIPPLRLTVGAKGSVLEVIEGWYEITIGAGYYMAKLSDGTILELPVVDEYSWYVGLSGDVRNYRGVNYTGLTVNGGMKIDLAVTKDMPFIKAGGSFNASAFAGVGNSGGTQRMYVMLGADGKIYGLVQIPDEAWAFGDLKLLSAEVDLALGGQTDFPITNTSTGDAAKSAFRNISGYGGVAYTGSIIGVPFRIYYIFQDKGVGVKVGYWGYEFEPFNPGPYSASLLNENTGEQLGILVANDNMVLLASSVWDGNAGMLADATVSTTPAAIKSVVTSENGVTITKKDETGRSYEVIFTDAAYDPKYMAFSLKLKEDSTLTPQELLGSMDISGSTTFTAILAQYNSKGEITNPDEANTVLGDDYVTLKLPSRGTWNFVSSGAPFDMACYYSNPFASLTNMDLSSDVITGEVKDMSSSSYMLRTYLGNEKGSTDYLISQTEIPSGGSISEVLALAGGAVSTGSYFVTTVLLEEIKEDFDGDGTVESDEVAYVKTDDFEFDESQKVIYTNNIQPNQPEEVKLEATGNENMRASWKEPAGGAAVDGYFIKLYQKNGSDWVATGANYILKQKDLAKNADGEYTFDMAVTGGNNNEFISPLEPRHNYMIGMTAFSYLGDEDGDGKNDKLPVESAEAKSSEQFLPEATYPKLTYDPQPVNSGEGGMKVLNIRESTYIKVKSDVNAKLIVTRMDMDESSDEAVIAQSYDSSSRELHFYTPDDFEGALNLKITATDVEGDVTVDYLGLRLDNVPPILTLDSYLFSADRNTGNFSITGVTEPSSKIMLAGTIVSEQGDGGAQLLNLDENDQVTADEDGVFALNGKLTAGYSSSVDADSALILLKAVDKAGNESMEVCAQIARSQMMPNSGSSTQSVQNSPRISIGPEMKPGQAVTAVIAVLTNGKIEDGTIKNAIEQAQSYAREHKKTTDGIAVVIDATTVKLDSLEITLGRAALENLVSVGTENLEIKGAAASLSLDLEALKEILKNSQGDVTITIAPAKNLSHDVLSHLGGRPALNVTASYVRSGKKVEISDLGVGTATVSIAYTPVENQIINHLFGIYADEEGNVTTVPGSHYQPGSRCLVLTTNHLSVYGVGYNEPSAKFTDVSRHWSKQYVDYVVGRGLLSGTSASTFAPDAPMTRGMLVTVLGRMSNVDEEIYTKHSFTDVNKDMYYHPYVEWAYQNNIVRGTGNEQFTPDRPVTRQELAVVFENYSKATGYNLPIIHEKADYKDQYTIDDLCKKASVAMQQAGIMMGDGENKFNPQSSSTRGEIAAMLQRYIKLNINPATAQGWSVDDMGQYRYYKSGKAFVGWQEIEGVKYFFNADGVLTTGWIKDRESWRYYFNNEMVKGWREIEGKKYYFNDDGTLQS